MIRFSLLGFGVWAIFREMSIAGAGSRSLIALPSFLGLNLGPFLIGMLLGWIWGQEKGRITPQAMVLLVMIGISAVFVRDQTADAITGIVVFVLSVTMALLLFYQGNTHAGLGIWVERTRTMLGNRSSTFLAHTSYGVYLSHLLIAVPMLALLCEVPPFVRQTPAIRFVILTAIAGPMTYLFAWIAYQVTEVRGIQWGRTLIKRIWPSRNTLRSGANANATTIPSIVDSVRQPSGG
jgi:peptidoglycan/LPS O-acetylase OafA/YrhL